LKPYIANGSIVSAMQFNDDADGYDVVHAINTGHAESGIPFCNWINNRLEVPLASGHMQTANPGDWIVHHGGQFYVVAKPIFEALYEKMLVEEHETGFHLSTIYDLDKQRSSIQFVVPLASWMMTLSLDEAAAIGHNFLAQVANAQAEGYVIDFMKTKIRGITPVQLAAILQNFRDFMEASDPNLPT